MVTQNTIQQPEPEPHSMLDSPLFGGGAVTLIVVLAGIIWSSILAKSRDASQETATKIAEKSEILLKEKFYELNSNLIHVSSNLENLKTAISGIDKRMAAQELTQPLIQELLKKDVNNLGESVRKLENELIYHIEMLNHFVELHNSMYPDTPFVKPKR